MKKHVLRFLIFLAIFSTILEAASRWVFLPYLKRASQAQKPAPEKQKIDISGYNLIAIGDSFVRTGADGWIRFLELKGWKVLNLGVGGACPSMYFQKFQEIQPQLQSNQIVLILLYIGNDFTDQSLWESLTSKENYNVARDKLYFRSNQLYWPYAEVDIQKVSLRERLKKQSAFLKVLGILKYSIQMKFKTNEPSKTETHSKVDRYMQVYSIHTLDRQNQLLTELLNENITQKENVFRINGRIFFLQHHNASAFDSSQANKTAAKHILQMVESLKNFRNVFVVPVLDREEIGESLHHQFIRRNEPYIESLKKQTLNLIDTNPLFEKEMIKENLYLPDGHWNLQGHELFAEALAKRLQSFTSSEKSFGQNVSPSSKFDDN